MISENAINSILQMANNMEVPVHLLNFIFQDTLRDYHIDLFDPTFRGMDSSGAFYSFGIGDSFYVEKGRLIMRTGIITHSNIADHKVYLRAVR